MALLTLGGIYIRTKQPELANEPLLGTLKLSEEIGSIIEMGSTLTNLARVRLMIGEHEEAVAIAASVAADPVSAGSRMAESATVGDEAEGVLKRARDAMDPAAYQAAEERGRATSIGVIAKELLAGPNSGS